MNPEHPEFRLPDEGVLRAHAHCIGNTGSGKQCPLLAALSLDTLTAFLAKYRDIRSFADLARSAEEPGRTASGTDGSENTEPTR